MINDFHAPAQTTPLLNEGWDEVTLSGLHAAEQAVSGDKSDAHHPVEADLPPAAEQAPTEIYFAHG